MRTLLLTALLCALSLGARADQILVNPALFGTWQGQNGAGEALVMTFGPDSSWSLTVAGEPRKSGSYELTDTATLRMVVGQGVLSCVYAVVEDSLLLSPGDPDCSDAPQWTRVR